MVTNGEPTTAGESKARFGWRESAEIARQSGKPVDYRNLSEPDYKAALLGAGLPEAFAGLLADSDAAAARGALFDDGRQLSTLIGRPTTPMAASVAEALTQR
jgi:NAD(P)H dehydrogenase (quinone)